MDTVSSIARPTSIGTRYFLVLKVSIFGLLSDGLRLHPSSDNSVLPRRRTVWANHTQHVRRAHRTLQPFTPARTCVFPGRTLADLYDCDWDCGPSRSDRPHTRFDKNFAFSASLR